MLGVITFKRFSPAERAKELDFEPQDELPLLRSSSDVIWALWEKLVLQTTNKANIKFFMSLSIENEDTLHILSRALAQVGSTLTADGRTFDTSTEEGRAILGKTCPIFLNISTRFDSVKLGCPNAVAFSYFLIQHKAELGNKVIDNVHVFQCQTGHKSPCLFFQVNEYAQNRQRPPQASSAQIRAIAGGYREKLNSSSQKGNLVRVHPMHVRKDSMMMV